MIEKLGYLVRIWQIYRLLYVFKKLKPLNFQKSFHIQGHRGARGLLPENTIASCCKAVALGVDGLEIDVVVSKDNQLIVSHEPWMSPLFCSLQEEEEEEEEEEEPVDRIPNAFVNRTPRIQKGILLRHLTVSEIQQYDCGILGNPYFPTQEPIKSYKPTFYELVSAVHTFCETENLKKPFWNIEVKSHPNWYGRLVLPPPAFVRLLANEIKKIGLDSPSTSYISSFDPHFLKEMKRQTPSVKLAFLTENRYSFLQNIRQLGFLPAIYSPYHQFLRKKTVENAHKLGVKIVTWTVNDVKTAAILRGWKVDGLITDFPNLINSL